MMRFVRWYINCRFEVAEIVKDMLKNPYNVVDVSLCDFDVLTFNVYIYLILGAKCKNRPFSHCLCACVYRSRGALFLDNRRDFTEMGQSDFKPLILSM